LHLIEFCTVVGRIIVTYVSMCMQFYVLQIFRVDALGSTNLLFNVLQFLTFYLFLFNILQFTRDALIVLAGSKEKGRDFVYFTEVKDIPSTDLATIERLWNKFSRGKFGYSVQKVRNYMWCYVYFPFDLSNIQANANISYNTY